MGQVRSQPKMAGYPDNRINQDRIKEAPLYLSSRISVWYFHHYHLPVSLHFYQVAEKRKTLLDELAIKYQEECDARREQVRKMEEQHRGEVEQLEQEQKQEREDLKQRIDSLKVKKERKNKKKKKRQIESPKERSPVVKLPHCKITSRQTL